MHKVISKYLTASGICCIAMAASTCDNKLLGVEQTRHPFEDGQQVAVSVQWGEDKPSSPPPVMRFNIMSLDPTVASYGIDEIASDGRQKLISLPAGYHGMAFCYDYEFNNYRFDAQQGMDISATSPRQRSASYEKFIHPTIAPEEETVADLPTFFVSHIPEFSVPAEQELTELVFTPSNVLRRYSFIIRNVKGSRYISAARGAITGMSATYRLATGPSQAKASTILFMDEVAYTPDTEDGTLTGTIQGGFYAFAPIFSAGVSHYFTIEIDTQGGNYYYYTWDVTDQMKAAEGTIPIGRGRNRSRATEADFDLVIDNYDLTIAIGGGNGDGPFSDTNPRHDDGSTALPPLQRGDKYPATPPDPPSGGMGPSVKPFEDVDWPLN